MHRATDFNLESIIFIWKYISAGFPQNFDDDFIKTLKKETLYKNFKERFSIIMLSPALN